MLTTALLVLALQLPVTAQAPRVTVHAEAGLEGVAVRVAGDASRGLARIEADLPSLPRWASIEVRIVKHQDDLGAAAGRRVPAWAVGLAFPDEGILVVAARGKRGELLDMDRTLQHELAHLALGKAFAGARVPRWLTEGFAYLHSSDVNLARAATLVGALVAGRIQPLSVLEATFPAEENEAQLAYAHAYDMVAWMARRGRWSDERDDGNPAAFRQFLTELAGGASLDDAARAAFGRRMVDLEAEWLASLRDRYLVLPLAFGGAALWGLGGVLLTLGWLRRRRISRRTLARWEIEEARFTAARSTEAEAPSVSDASAGPAEARSP